MPIINQTKLADCSELFAWEMLINISPLNQSRHHKKYDIYYLLNEMATTNTKTPKEFSDWVGKNKSASHLNNNYLEYIEEVLKPRTSSFEILNFNNKGHISGQLNGNYPLIICKTYHSQTLTFFNKKFYQHINNKLSDKGEFYIILPEHDHFIELNQLLHHFDPRLNFKLEWNKTTTIKRQMRYYFDQIDVTHYEKIIMIEEVDLLYKYIISFCDLLNLKTILKERGSLGLRLYLQDLICNKRTIKLTFHFVKIKGMRKNNDRN